MMVIYGLYKTKKNWGGCHHLFLLYDASKLSVCHVCSKMTSSRPSAGT